jgi:hypothetical protein
MIILVNKQVAHEQIRDMSETPKPFQAALITKTTLCTAQCADFSNKERHIRPTTKYKFYSVKGINHLKHMKQ